MTTFLAISINAQKQVTIEEHEFPDNEDVDQWASIRNNISPPYNGKTLVVEKDKVRTFRLRTEVVEIR